LIDPLSHPPGNARRSTISSASPAPRKKGYRSLVHGVLTKPWRKTSPISHEQGIQRPLHAQSTSTPRAQSRSSGIAPLAFDALVGINLLREGPRHSRMPPPRRWADLDADRNAFAQRDLADPAHRLAALTSTAAG